MPRNQLLLDLLFEAAQTEVGLIVAHEDPVKLRWKLREEQKKVPELKDLALVLSPTNPQGELWIVRKK